MPEGDTIFRTAATLRSAIGGRTLIRATGESVADLPDQTQIQSVEPLGKHLLIRFDESSSARAGSALRNHLFSGRCRIAVPFTSSIRRRP